jgi:hypothetical protein
MELKKFWNKAIEFYCTNKNSDSLKHSETVFMPISEESLERVKEKYISEGGITEQEIQLLKNNIDNVGGFKNSYYSAVRAVHNDFNKPSEFSFLRFSILVVGAFKQDNSPLKNYWEGFDSFLGEKNISCIPNNSRTSYLKAILINLTKSCSINQKTFFQLNVFGETSPIINVGKIKAHSIFQGKTLKEIKKAIYILGYSETHNIEDLNYDDVKLILEESGENRIINLFNRDNDAKEIVFVCLKIWLQKWIPDQEEKVKLLNGQSSEFKPKLQIFRIWAIDVNNEIEIKYGFILKSNLGEDNIFYLNKNKNVYVDVAWGVRLNENRMLYIVENYVDNVNLNENELGFSFKACGIELNIFEHALEKIPNRMYFIEHTEKIVKIQDNPVLLASKYEVEDEKVDFFHLCKIKNQNSILFKLYRIRDSFESFSFQFIKTNNLAIFPIGISDGRPGVKSFLSSFPIKIKYNNLSNGEIQVFHNCKILKPIIPSKASNNLEFEENIGLLESGTYSIKYFNEEGKYENFSNGKDSISFEIVESGIGDGRNELTIDTVAAFEFHEFGRLSEIKNIEESYLILYDFDSNLKFKDAHTFFYFKKNNNDEWTIHPSRQSFFIQKLKERPHGFKEIYYRYKEDFKYLSKSFVKYDYKVSFCKSPETIDLPFNLNEFYQRNEECRITSNKIKINCYYFRLEELDDALKVKYPEVEIGDVIFIISNKSEPKPENLLKILNQEVFPFKKM